ncbi:phospholipase A(1) DAD1, chloroplastic-like [Diospyros lotus]|uniref:phospholipase A(1) DAD1, chloroplastic-like n=1 Tax=Diospyros lotus TaxID=55363 RepID=UPI0022587D11|nr:phospholipase A(1) DAD1, chloroplastic-like [Diospyros lotus]
MRLAVGGGLRPWKVQVPKQLVAEPVTNYGRAPPVLGGGRMRLMRLVITNSSKSVSGKSARGRVATPPAKLGDRWMEYQGSKNWEGLLDPLDDDLRSEILRYGEFVEAAYRSFEFDRLSPEYATCRHSRTSMMTQCGLGGSGYRLTRNLRATCGVQFPRWIERAPRWVSTPSSWIGYVAVCNDKDEIARLGRRDVVIAFRGTATCLEWIENLRATLTCLDGHASDNRDEDPMVESGFLSLYTSQTATCPSLQDAVRDEISKIIHSYRGEPLSITIVGHSLGAALATLTAFDITTTFDHAPPVTVISFGGPRVGNRSFRRQLDKAGTKILRIVNSDDLITKVPGFVIDNNDAADGKAVHVAGLSSWLQKRVEDTRWAYADVGRELRLCSSESPYVSKGDVAASHDLKTYLHLINGFVSSTCPFRATARRVLRKAKAKGYK